jgi:hypothetical protein
MSKIAKIIGIVVSLAFFGLGVYVLTGSRFRTALPKEGRVIFALFLFLWGAWRLTRYIFKNPDRDE